MATMAFHSPMRAMVLDAARTPLRLASLAVPKTEAMALLERAHQQHPTDRDVLLALVSIARDKGDPATALRHSRELLLLAPADPQLRALVADLERRQAP